MGLLGRFFELLNIQRGYLNGNDRDSAMHKSWGHIFTNHIVGDYIEFGVYKGDLIIRAYTSYLAFRKHLNNELISKEQWRRNVSLSYANHSPSFYGLDTFSGMPENNEGSLQFAHLTYL